MSMKQREFIQKIIDLRGYKSYLEIGVQFGITWNAIRCKNKTGVDIIKRDNVIGDIEVLPSDVFFLWNEKIFDLIFIDGDHTYEQSKKDVMNAIKALNEGGIIVMHDCRPRVLEDEFNEKSGQVWKTIVDLRKMPGISCCVVDEDSGLGVVTLEKNKKILDLNKVSDFNYYLENQKELLNLISSDDFFHSLSTGGS